MIRVYFLLFLFLFPLASQAVVEARNRVEELFIWKISDEMKLSVPDEKSFSDLIRSLNRKRSEANENLQLTLRKLGEARNSKEREKLLTEHRRALKTYNDLSIDEVDQILKLFGADRAAQYFVLKNDLTNKLKSLLASPEKPTGAPLAPPKVIEEK